MELAVWTQDSPESMSDFSAREARFLRGESAGNPRFEACSAVCLGASFSQKVWVFLGFLGFSFLAWGIHLSWACGIPEKDVFGFSFIIILWLGSECVTRRWTNTQGLRSGQSKTAMEGWHTHTQIHIFQAFLDDRPR